MHLQGLANILQVTCDFSLLLSPLSLHMGRWFPSPLNIFPQKGHSLVGGLLSLDAIMEV